MHQNIEFIKASPQQGCALFVSFFFLLKFLCSQPLKFVNTNIVDNLCMFMLRCQFSFYSPRSFQTYDTSGAGILH